MSEETAKTESVESKESGSEALDTLKAELEKLKTENGKLKAAQSNASAEAAKYKRDLQARMSEQEKAENATKELIEQLKADNEAMRRSQTVAERTASYIGLGFDASLAKRAAEASFDGKHDDLVECFAKFIEAHDKAKDEERLRGTPRPGSGAVSGSVTKEQFEKMGYRDRAKLFAEQPELYQELIK